MKPRDIPLYVFALFCAAMMGLAAGASWMVAAMYLRAPLRPARTRFPWFWWCTRTAV